MPRLDLLRAWLQPRGPDAHWVAAAALACAGLSATASHAQVHRCTDAQGHVTYTNAPCAAGEAAVLVQPAPSAQERAQQQLQHEQALQRRAAERAAQAQRDAQAQALQLHAEQLRASQAAQAAAERAAHAQQAAADAAAARAAPPLVRPAWGSHGSRPPPHLRPHPPHGAQPPSSGWQCNVFRCTDGQGRTRPLP